MPIPRLRRDIEYTHFAVAEGYSYVPGICSYMFSSIGIKIGALSLYEYVCPVQGFVRGEDGPDTF